MSAILNQSEFTSKCPVTPGVTQSREGATFKFIGLQRVFDLLEGETMAVWLVRAGKHGELEQKFFQEGRIYVAWDHLNFDLSAVDGQLELKRKLVDRYPEEKAKTIMNWASQLWPFAGQMSEGDLVIMPLKAQRAIRIGRISGSYMYESKGPKPFFHWRSVHWLSDAIPRTHFGKDLLNSFGAFMTFCRIKRNNAEERLARMEKNNWAQETIASQIKKPISAEDEATDETDYQELCQDQITKLIKAKFSGHGLTRLIEEILRAQGYHTYRSPEGADHGADIIAGLGPMGFDRPRLCVEVKSEDTPIDRPAIDKLLGAVSKFDADFGLFVAWGGFRAKTHLEIISSFFQVRLWTQKEILENLFTNYHKFDEDLRAELPLKQVWAVAAPED